MNANGLDLLERVAKGNNPELLKRIDRCAYYARTKKEIEVIEFRKLMTKDKVFAELLTVHLLARILGETY